MSKSARKQQEGDASLPNGIEIDRGDQFDGPGATARIWTVVMPCDVLDVQGTNWPTVWLESSGDNRWIGHEEFARLLDAEKFRPVTEDGE